MPTFDLARFAQRADMNLTNMDEAIRKWVDFVSAPTGNITMQYYDRNGNLQTITFPNRQALVNQLIADANSVMSKTVYVDQVNGDDGNDGSVNRPFKTLQKAINSVPAGGVVYINLLSDIDYTTSGEVSISIENRTVYINGNWKTIRVGWYNVYGYMYLLLCFLLANSKLHFLNTYIEITNIGLPSNPVYHTWRNKFVLYGTQSSYLTPSVITFNWFNRPDNNKNLITINSPAHLVGHIGDWSDINNSFCTFSISSVNVSNNNIQIRNGAVLSSISLGSINIAYLQFIDENGNVKSARDYITNIVRDSNGVPRNIVSNIVL
ncbi:hypothetical protein [Sulfurihydrogenibium sp.]|uniref:hypothetical protein n=1 Tax=Sulfurihydrogenibium sp. TaxID=2053621 RepID=UPI0026037E8D|nr:hypothetical protein [Sulfurihydrogenibium sp.]